MTKQVLSFIKQYHMTEKGDHVIAAVSGGADSVCLLLVLLELAEELEITLSAVHVEHGIRGEESRADARFVERLCEEHHIPCRTFSCDAVSYAKEQGMTLEEGARKLRYDFFETCRRESGAKKIAVAHHQNDSVETMLFHMARGTGLNGMCGIPPVRDAIIRPLLCVNRAQIETYLAAKKQEYCTDVTNQELTYTRNKIRHRVLPVLCQVNGAAVEHLYEESQLIAEAFGLIEDLTKQRKEKLTESFDGGVFLSEDVTKEPPLIQKEMILKVLGDVAGSRKDIGAVHVEQIRNLLELQVGRSIQLPYEMIAERTYGGVRIRRGKKEHPKQWSFGLAPGDRHILPENGMEITARLLQKPFEFQEIPKKTYTKWFDYDKIKNSLSVRNRCQGDYLTVDRSGGTQSLKKYLINEKVPSGKRDSVVLVADGHHIIWAVGYRISECYKVTEETTHILEIQMNGGNDHE